MLLVASFKLKKKLEKIRDLEDIGFLIKYIKKVYFICLKPDTP